MNDFLRDLTFQDLKMGSVVVLGALFTFGAGKTFSKYPSVGSVLFAIGMLLELSVFIEKNRQFRDLRRKNRLGINKLQTAMVDLSPTMFSSQPDFSRDIRELNEIERSKPVYVQDYMRQKYRQITALLHSSDNS